MVKNLRREVPGPFLTFLGVFGPFLEKVEIFGPQKNWKFSEKIAKNGPPGQFLEAHSSTEW